MTDWDKIFNHDCVNSAFDTFMENFIKTYNDCFPFREVKMKQKKKNPGSMLNLRKCVSGEVFIANPSCHRKNVHSFHKNISTSEIRKRKRKYYFSKFK